MPTYRAKCTKCNHEWEYSVRISESDVVPACPEKDCKSQDTKKLPVSNSGGFILKGGGWYRSGGHK